MSACNLPQNNIYATSTFDSKVFNTAILAAVKEYKSVIQHTSKFYQESKINENLEKLAASIDKLKNENAETKNYFAKIEKNKR